MTGHPFEGHALPGPDTDRYGSVRSSAESRLVAVAGSRRALQLSPAYLPSIGPIEAQKVSHPVCPLFDPSETYLPHAVGLQLGLESHGVLQADHVDSRRVW